MNFWKHLKIIKLKIKLSNITALSLMLPCPELHEILIFSIETLISPKASPKASLEWILIFSASHTQYSIVSTMWELLRSINLISSACQPFNCWTKKFIKQHFIISYALHLPPKLNLSTRLFNLFVFFITALLMGFGNGGEEAYLEATKKRFSY